MVGLDYTWAGRANKQGGQGLGGGGGGGEGGGVGVELSYTLHPTPYTIHPTPYILHPTSYTLKKARTRNSQTRNSPDPPRGFLGAFHALALINFNSGP